MKNTENTTQETTSAAENTVDAKESNDHNASAPPINAAADISSAADPIAEMRARAAAEQERIAAIRKVCSDDHAEIAAKAIAQGWDVTRTELEILRAERPTDRQLRRMERRLLRRQLSRPRPPNNHGRSTVCFARCDQMHARPEGASADALLEQASVLPEGLHQEVRQA